MNASSITSELPLLPLDDDQASAKTRSHSPLAHRLRPTCFEDVVGQEHLLHADGVLGRSIATGKFPSLLFWGPPGTGKTTLARLIAEASDSHFIGISAISEATKELRQIFQAAAIRHQQGKQTLLFVDEIHRFNRAQQDLFLPYIEDGTILLIGATTENPSFALNNALLSRAQVLTLKSLDAEALNALITRAEQLKSPLPVTKTARELLVQLADGDGRYVLNMVESLQALEPKTPLDEAELLKTLQRRKPLYDKSQDGHYSLISALHKSLRGSDPQAALYWFARMIEGGEDARYIARRLVRFASEDIGLADPNALVQAMEALRAYELLGSPEGELAIAQSVLYLATAPKSNAAYTAFKDAMRTAKETGSAAPPKIIINAPTAFMKEEGYGKSYQYDPNTPHGFSGQNYFPDTLQRTEFYTPKERGFEREVKKRLEYWNDLRQKLHTNHKSSDT